MTVKCTHCGSIINTVSMSYEFLSKLFSTGIINITCNKCGTPFEVSQKEMNGYVEWEVIEYGL